MVEGYFARHRVKPGITGWAQINGWRGETDTEEKIQRRVEHDLYYIENWSLLLDLYILAHDALPPLNTEQRLLSLAAAARPGRPATALAAAFGRRRRLDDRCLVFLGGFVIFEPAPYELLLVRWSWSSGRSSVVPVNRTSCR